MAEERRGLEQMAMTAAVNLSRAWQLSSHVRNMCSEAHEAIYTREADVKHWLEKGKPDPGLSLKPATMGFILPSSCFPSRMVCFSFYVNVTLCL